MINMIFYVSVQIKTVEKVIRLYNKKIDLKCFEK